jgi:hypothetical protein
METFKFVIIPHLILSVLGLTNDYSHASQQKVHNIVSGVNIIVFVKSRDDGRVMATTYFFGGRNIIVSNMDENLSVRGYPRSSHKILPSLKGTNF